MNIYTLLGLIFVGGAVVWAVRKLGAKSSSNSVLRQRKDPDAPSKSDEEYINPVTTESVMQASGEHNPSVPNMPADLGDENNNHSPKVIPQNILETGDQKDKVRE